LCFAPSDAGFVVVAAAVVAVVVRVYLVDANDGVLDCVGVFGLVVCSDGGCCLC